MMSLDCACYHSNLEGKIKSIESHLKTKTSEATRLEFESGQVLFYKGHYPCGVFILQKGSVKFSDGREASVEPVALGINHLLTETPYCSSCEAGEKVEVLFYPKHLLEPLIGEI